MADQETKDAIQSTALAVVEQQQTIVGGALVGASGAAALTDGGSQSQFDILDIIHIVFLKKWIMILIVILSTLLGALLYAIYPQTYKGELIIKLLNEEDNHKYIVITSLFKILKSTNDVEFHGEDQTNENTLSNTYLANYFINKFNSKIELRENILKYSNDIINRGDYSSMDEEEYTYSISALDPTEGTLIQVRRFVHRSFVVSFSPVGGSIFSSKSKLLLR